MCQGCSGCGTDVCTDVAGCYGCRDARDALHVPQADGGTKVWKPTDHHGKALLTAEEEAKLGELIWRGEQAAAPVEASTIKQRASEHYRARTRSKELPDGVKFGDKWLRGPRRRLAARGFHTSSRLPQALEADRAAALTPDRTRQCLKLWEQVRATGNHGGPFSRARTYSVDEIGHGGKQRYNRVVVPRGTRRVFQRCPARGVSYTQVACFSMEGVMVPSALIFHGKSVPADVLSAAGDWACLAKEKSHMMDGPAWHHWLDFFAEEVGASRREPVLLKLDNHGSREAGDNLVHAKSLGVEIFALDSHSTSARCEVDTHLGAPVKRKLRTLKQEKARRCPGVARMGLAEEVRLLRAATEFVSAPPNNLAKAWLDTGFSDGTELGVSVERALA